MNVAVLGPGLLGGSIALALKERGGHSVAIWARREESAREALQGGFADRASTEISTVVSGAEMVVLATPVGSMPDLAREAVRWIAPGTIVTDVGSVKSMVVRDLGPILDGHARFVGSHPMAGSEKTGMAAACARLFEGRPCIVTPLPETDPEAEQQVCGFWEMLGARVFRMTPEEHDARVALISHFPHLLAACLVNMAVDQDPAALDLCGPGFRDTTRVASGSPGMWVEILRSNGPAVKKSVEAMIEKLGETLRLLGSDCPEEHMHAFLTHAKAERDRLRLPK